MSRHGATFSSANVDRAAKEIGWDYVEVLSSIANELDRRRIGEAKGKVYFQGARL